MIEDIVKDIQEAIADEAIVAHENTGLQPSIRLDPAYLVEVCTWLRDSPKYYFDFLANITAVDYHPEERFAVVSYRDVLSIYYPNFLLLPRFGAPRIGMSEKRST
jgi:NADH-quinone oxidoreductase subunit C